VSSRPRYLLDTNICIHLMKHQPPEVAERFARCRVGEVRISANTPEDFAACPGLAIENWVA
jgi:predicted nucleic acid-binding protein